MAREPHNKRNISQLSTLEQQQIEHRRKRTRTSVNECRQRQRRERHYAEVTRSNIEPPPEDDLSELGDEDEIEIEVPKQDHEFISRVIARAKKTPPVVDNQARKLVKECRQSKTIEEMDNLVTTLQYMGNFDIHLTVTSALLRAQLQKPFETIVIPASSGLFNTFEWGIEKQINSLGKGRGPAYQPTKRTDGENLTQPITDESIRAAFLDPATRKLPEYRFLNVLNMKNTSPHTFALGPVSEEDLVYRMSVLERQLIDTPFDVQSESVEVPVHNEWMLLTKENATSPTHNDHAGQCTFVACIEGAKMWARPRGGWSEVWPQFVSNDNRWTGYRLGMFASTLRPGWAYIQSPLSPHTVYTRKDSLFVGRFFYTATHFARSIFGINVGLLAGKSHENEDPSTSDWKRLTWMMERLGLHGALDRYQLAAVHNELRTLLLDQKELVRSASLGRLKSTGKSKKVLDKLNRSRSAELSPEQLGEQAKAKFMVECGKRWEEGIPKDAVDEIDYGCV